MTKRITLLILIAVGSALLAGTFSVTAQTDPDPIILNQDGYLWAWNGPDQPLEQLTALSGYRPYLSPDGTRIATMSTAQIARDWLESVGGGGGFIPPYNILVLDIPSGQVVTIADQPVDAVYNGPQGPGKYTLRGGPAWSPDGTQLAWVEVGVDAVSAPDDPQSVTAQLIRYDLTSSITTVLDEYPLEPNNSANSELYEVTWGPSGIGVAMGVLPWAAVQEYRVYDASGTLISQMALAEDSTARSGRAEWISAPDQDYLFDPQGFTDPVYTPSGTWYNWRTGNEELMTLMPEMVSLTAPDGARIFASDGTWYVEFPGQAPVDLGNVTPFGIARDGQAVLYGRWEVNPATNGHAYTVLIHTADDIIEIGRFFGIRPVWGPVAWRTRQ